MRSSDNPLVKTIFPGCLAAPPSPMIPRTPFEGSAFFAAAQSGGVPPRTPYTPYTAFQSKSNPFFAPSSVESSIYLLDDTGNPLASLYNAVLRFVDRDLRPIMDAAEQIGVKRPAVTTGDRALANGHAGDSLTIGNAGKSGDGYDILANVVWAEVSRGIMDDLGSTVFAVGRPEEFRRVCQSGLYRPMDLD